METSRERAGASLGAGLATDSAWSLVLEGLTLATAMVSFLLLGRELGPEGYGAWVGVFAIVGPLGGLTWAGVAMSTLQRVRRDGGDLATTAGRAATLTMVGGVSATVVGLALAAVTLEGLALWVVAALMFAELVLAAGVQVASWVVLAADGFPAAARVRLLLVVTRFAVVVGVAATVGLTVARLAVGFVVAFAVVLVVVLVRLRRWRPPPGWERPDRRSVREAAEYSAPAGLMLVQRDADRVVLNANGLVADAGLYGAAYRVVNLGLAPLGAIDNAAFPRFLDDDRSVAGLHLRRSVRYSLLLAGMASLIAAVLWVIAPSLEWFVGEEFAESVDIVRVLVLVVPLQALRKAPVNGLVGLGHTWAKGAVHAVGATVALTTYLVAIPSMGWEGAVLGTLLGEVALIVVSWSALIGLQRRRDVAVG